MTRKIVLGREDEETGDAEWATTQIEHCASSLALECWCVAEAYADNNIRNRQNPAIGFNTHRMMADPVTVADRIYTEITAGRKSQISPAIERPFLSPDPKPSAGDSKPTQTEQIHGIVITVRGFPGALQACSIAGSGAVTVAT
jgi:hypothetical protein